MELTSEQKQILIECRDGRLIRTDTGFEWWYSNSLHVKNREINDDVLWPLIDEDLFDNIRKGYDYNIFQINDKGKKILAENII